MDYNERKHKYRSKYYILTNIQDDRAQEIENINGITTSWTVSRAVGKTNPSAELTYRKHFTYMLQNKTSDPYWPLG